MKPSSYGKASFSGSASFVADPRLQRVASGYIDHEIVTVRKMAAAGATADEIGAAIGKSAMAARGIIRRNNIAWSHKSSDRHVAKSAQAIGSHMDRGACGWHDKALEMRRAGASQAEISKACGVSLNPVGRFLQKHGLGRIKLANDKRTSRPAPASKKNA